MRNVVIGVILLVLVAGAGWYLWSTESGSRMVWHNANKDMITLDLIKPGVTVLPTFTVTGQARGTWYFEASFPVEVLDKDGRRLASTAAKANGDWMTDNFVPFSATLTIENYSGPATLVLHKDNPSGLPENEASVSIPIEVFETH